MGPKTTSFKELKEFIEKRPKEADALAAKWQEFAKQNPDTLPTDTEILLGKDIEEAYFYLRDQHEDEQVQTQGGVNPSSIPTELLTLSVLALAFRDRPKLMEDDKDYQKIAEEHKKLWLEKNPGKDFTKKEGLDYLHGSLEDENAPSLKKDAEKAFRDNPKYRKRLERYDKESKKVYKNPDEDPALIKTRREIEDHIKSRHAYLKTHEDKKTPEETSALIQRRSWERFAAEHHEKAKAYAEKNIDIKRSYEKQEIKKQLAEMEQKTGRQVRYVEKIHRPQGMAVEEATRRPESIIPTQQLPISPEGRTTIPQPVRGRFGPQGRRVASGIGRLGTRLVGQAGLAVGRAVAGALVSNPIGWIVIGVIIAIILIVFLIIMLAGGGGGIGGGPPPALPRLYECKFGGFPTSFPANCNSGPPVRCVGPGTGELVSVDAPDGNTCAANAAVNYSEIEGVTITTKCVDKCIDNSVTNVCEPDSSNACPDPNPSCGASGVVLKTFCIEYTIVPATPTP